MWRIQRWRYGLVGAGWLLGAIALPLAGVNLNAYLNWRSTVSTWTFIVFLLSRPWPMIRDWMDPTVAHGALGGGMVATPTSATLDVMWLGVVIFGLVMIVVAPVIVARVHTLRGLVVARCLGLSLLVLPMTLLAPEAWRLPMAREGMYLLVGTHVLVLVALLMGPRVLSAEGAFPVQVKE